jgi:hypothetical protein
MEYPAMAKHAVAALDPGGEAPPSEQAVHEVAPEVAEYLPAAQ